MFHNSGRWFLGPTGGFRHGTSRRVPWHDSFLHHDGAPKSGIEFVLVQSLLQPLGFHDVRMHLGAVGDGSDALMTPS